MTVNVGGLTAANQDWNSSPHTAIPLVFGFVLLLAFVLLLVSFRSLVIAVKAIVLDRLSVGAAWGVLVWIFQNGHLQGLLGFHSTHAITSWLPIFMFVLLFGLSMDCHVFILSRIREGHLASLRTDSAVGAGIKSSAGIVTAAARGHGHGVPDFRHPVPGVPEASWHRAGHRRPARRHPGAHRPVAYQYEIARQMELVPAPLAQLDPPDRPPAQSGDGADR
jgi:hypothetical protein